MDLYYYNLPCNENFVLFRSNVWCFPSKLSQNSLSSTNMNPHTLYCECTLDCAWVHHSENADCILLCVCVFLLHSDTALASSTCSSTTQPLTNQNVDHALPLQAHAGQNIVHSPPPRGREVLIGSMELKMEEVMKDIEDRDINKVYTSYPFPFVSQSQHFQLHFYPNNKECTHCVLHLMMLRPSSPLSPSHPSLSRLSAQVCVYEGGIKDVPAEALPNSPLRTSTKMMDHMATPTQDDAQYMAVFPNLLSHRELAEVRHNTLVIKAVLEHTIASS